MMFASRFKTAHSPDDGNTHAQLRVGSRIPAKGIRLPVTPATLAAATLAALLGTADLLEAQQDVNSHRITTLVERLGATDYRLREQAHRDLLAIGPTATGRLTQATQHADPEVSLRASRLLQDLRRRTRWRGSIITLPSMRLPAANARDSIERQSGIPISLHEIVQEAENPPVAVRHTELEFWPAIELLSTHLDTTVQWQFNTSGHSTLVGRPGRERLAVAFAGAMRCEVVSLRPTFPNSGGDETSHGKRELTLCLSWEPKLNVVSVQAQPRVCWSTPCARSLDASFRTTPCEWRQTAEGLPCCTVTVPIAAAHNQGPPRLKTVEVDVIARESTGIQDRRTIRFDFSGALLSASPSQRTGRDRLWRM